MDGMTAPLRIHAIFFAASQHWTAAATPLRSTQAIALHASANNLCP